MALVNLGTTVVGISGTAAGLTFARNKAGTYCKTWARPSNPKSSYQVDWRAVWTTFAPAWRGMSTPERLAWNTLAATPPETDRNPFSTVVLRSGWQWFARINSRRSMQGLGPTVTPPTSASQIAPVLTSFLCRVPAYGPDAVYVTLSPTQFAAGEFGYLYFAFSPSPGAQTPPDSARYILSFQPNGVSGGQLTSWVLLKFPAWPAGWRAWLSVRRASSDFVFSPPTLYTTETTIT